MSKVVLGMSGGVDSSVAAAILKEQGHEVIGLFMKNWDEVDENGYCSAEEDYKDVARVCDHLGIDYYSVEFVEEYQKHVFSHFLDEYKKGRTPNPDILCNREVKFKLFFDYALRLGADFIATGHYARVRHEDDGTALLKGLDGNKDQSYFLAAVNQERFSKSLFPLGELTKQEVRKKAEELGLSVAKKKDSTGICFIGERPFREFLAQYVSSSKGEFRNLNNEVVGRHEGAVFYTCGQRKGLGLGGAGEPWYVLGKSMDENIVYVERGEHPILFSPGLDASSPTWVQNAPEELPFSCKAKVRYRQKDVDCIIKSIGPGGLLKVRFPVEQRAIAAGQTIAFYQGDKCLGCAVIEKKWPSEASKLLKVHID